MTASIVQAALALTSWLDLAIVGKATIILTFGLAALPLTSRARASVRHLLMAATFGTVLVLPLAMGVVPAVAVHVPRTAAEQITKLASSGTSMAVARASSRVPAERTRSGDYRSVASFATLLRFIWASGGILLLFVLVIDLRRLRALRRCGLPWPAQNELLRSLAVTSGVRGSVDLLLHEDISAPVTYGLWRPAILLPVDASDWQEADLRRALVHELEHVRRADWATQLLARVACALYWFHPLAWMAWGRLRLEAERACDDAVVECAECTDYAEQLVTLARRLSGSRPMLSLAMANRTHLSARVVALLDGTRPRGRVGYGTTASVVSVASIVVLMVASLRALAAPTESPSTAVPTRQMRGNAVASGVPDRRVRLRGTIVPEVTHVNPAHSTGRRTHRANGERTTSWRDTTGNTQSTRSFIEGPIGGTSTGEWTISNSASASGTATSSGSASSETNGRRHSNN